MPKAKGNRAVFNRAHVFEARGQIFDVLVNVAVVLEEVLLGFFHGLVLILDTFRLGFEFQAEKRIDNRPPVNIISA